MIKELFSNRNQLRQLIITAALILTTAAALCMSGCGSPAEDPGLVPEEGSELDALLTVDLLPPNEYSRPQEPLPEVKGVVIHYVNNPGTSAENNREYFESLAETGATYASSHYIIDIDGSILQCIPLAEISYCSNERNKDTVAIECCHPDATGVFTEETYDSLVKLTAWLCGEFNISSGSVIRHYDVTGKLCPAAFVADRGYWYRLKADVAKLLGETGLASQYSAMSADLDGVPEKNYEKAKAAAKE